MVVVRGRRERAEDGGVAVVAEVGQVGDVELEFTAVLGQGQKRGYHLPGGGRKGTRVRGSVGNEKKKGGCRNSITHTLLLNS